MNAAVLSRPIRRFAWKEYRTLRGLWWALLGMGLFFDWFFGVALAPTTDFATVRFGVALTAALCYAAGAASILFSVEHEEQTYEFLRGLPTTWLPVYLGKLLIAALSAVGLAALLAFVGLLTSGHAPDSDSVSLTLGILGIGIFEALAWGTLCSMFLKRPLVAAVATFFFGGLVVNLAVNVGSSDGLSSTDPFAYLHAIPLRLTIVVVVLAASVVRARRWFPVAIESRPSPGGYFKPALLRSVSKVAHPSLARAARPRRRRMLARLIWNSWRESWKVLLLPVVLAAACLLLVVLFEQLWPQTSAPVTLIAVATVFFAPTLYGALAFSADQRRERVRFLAEHAAAPRYVWLSRHVVWFGAMAVIVLILSVLFVGLIVRSIEQHSRLNEQQASRQQYSSYYQTQEIRIAAETAASWMSLGTWGVLAAYALGQVSSMLLRSEILSAFMALILAAVLAAWVSVVLLWQLSVWLFLLPLVIGPLWATWLRAPGWIEGRNHWRAWVKPTLAIAATFAFIGVAMPIARLDQIGRVANPMWGVEGVVNETAEMTPVTKTPDAEATITANMYLQAANLLQTWPDFDPLARWSEFATVGGPEDSPNGIDQSRIPADELDAFHTALKKSQDQIEAQRQQAFKLAIEASKRPTCHFDFHLSARSYPGQHHRIHDTSWIEVDGSYDSLIRLQGALCDLPYAGVGEDLPFDRLLAGLRMSAHLRAGQPTVINVRQLKEEQRILERIGEWAFHADRTNDERRTALDELEKFFAQPMDVYGALLADHAQVRKVILGEESPLIFNEKPIAQSTYLAFLANKLPWERERARLALDVVTNQNLRSAHELIAYLANNKPRINGVDAIGAWLRPDAEGATWQTRQPAATTSYLMSMEYSARVPVAALFRQLIDTKTIENATLIRVALAMFRQDHDEYPNSLAELMPKYLKAEPLDPYAMQPFQFEPRGLNEPLIQSGFSEQMRIEAHTPFFWTIGPNKLQLQRVESVDASTYWAPGAWTDAQLQGPFFVQTAREWLFGNISSPVFVLPK